jgi:hypothetical protein
MGRVVNKHGYLCMGGIGGWSPGIKIKQNEPRTTDRDYYQKSLSVKKCVSKCVSECHKVNKK